VEGARPGLPDLSTSSTNPSDRPPRDPLPFKAPLTASEQRPGVCFTATIVRSMLRGLSFEAKQFAMDDKLSHDFKRNDVS
jgi:hypothetical protein